MKLSYYDWLMALAFNPRYQKEYYAIFPAKLELFFGKRQALEEFKKRWGIESPFDPREMQVKAGETTTRSTGGGIFSDYQEMVKVIRQKIDIPSDDILKFASDLRERRYLTIQIDITADETKTLADIKDYIRFYRKTVKFKARGRVKPSKDLDYWVIYKKYQAEGKSALQIAKEITGKKENPAYSDDVNKKHKQVLRALHKAKAMISK